MSLMTILLLFITPILYPPSAPSRTPTSPSPALNPLVGVLETFRWAMLPDASPPGLLLYWSPPSRVWCSWPPASCISTASSIASRT